MDTNNLKIITIIPARKGSKRLINKNITLLGGKPLIQWSLDQAKLFFSNPEIIVSTDSEEIAEIVGQNGINVPWIRPDHLATDEASSADVAIHALDWYEEKYGPVDGLLLLQPTSPFRSLNDITKIVDLFCQNNLRPIVSVSIAKSHPFWTYEIWSNSMIPFIPNDGISKRSQDLPPAYSLNGNLYLISPKDLRAEKTFVPSNSIPFITEEYKNTIDIDTRADLEYAQWLLMREVD